MAFLLTLKFAANNVPIAILLVIFTLLRGGICCDPNVQNSLQTVPSSTQNQNLMNYKMNPRDQIVPDTENKAVIDQQSLTIRDAINYFDAAGTNFSAANSIGDNALMVAAASGDVSLVDRLLDHGARVNSANQQNSTALMLAARYGNFMVVQTLLSAGSNIDATDYLGFSALMQASQFGHVETAQFLCTSGANVSQRSIYGNLTALILAAVNNQAPVIRVLVDCGADVNDHDSNGWSAIRLAARNYNVGSVMTLRSLNANITDCPIPLCQGVL